MAAMLGATRGWVVGGCLLGHDKDNMDEQSAIAPRTTKGGVCLSMGEVSVREQLTTRDQGTTSVRCLSENKEQQG